MSVTPFIFWIGLAEMLFYISGFIVHAAAGRILGPADYGVYGLIVTLTILIASLIGNGIPIAMSKFLSEALANKPQSIHAIKRQGAIAQFIVMGVITAIFFFGAPVIAWMLRDPSLTPLLRISAFIIPCFSADSFYFYYYTGIHQFNMQSILKSLRAVLRVTIIVGMGYFLSLKGFITGYIYVPLAVFILAFIVDKFVYARKFTKQAGEFFAVKKLLIYALPITGFLLLYQAMVSVNLFVVKAILQNDYLTGLFNGAFTIAQIPSYLFYALTIVLLPAVSHSVAQNDKQKTSDTITASLRIMTLFLIPIVVLIIAYAEPLMIFFFGAPYAAGASALQILAFGLGILTLFYVMSFAFQGAGLVRIPLKIAFFGMLINAILNVFLIKPLGLTGSGLATSVTAIFVIGALFYYLRKKFNAGIRLLSVVKMLLAGLVIFGLSFFLPGQKLLFIPWGAFLFLVYIGILFLFKELKRDDVQLLKSMLPKLGQKKDRI